jgi:predicted AAA+ superfamily ATPase
MVNNMLHQRYLSRIIEKTIEEYLHDSSAIYISGPRDCGKTTTCKNYAKSKIILNDYDEASIGLLSKEAILNDEFPRLIDE